MSKEEIIDYVMNSPANSNEAVLRGMLDDIGGVNVPTPTVEDAGKILEVGEDGKYALKEASQGGGSSGDLSLWVINVTGAPIVADKTFEDITNALEQGKYPIVIYKAFANASPEYLPLYGLESDYYYIFSHSYYEPENEGSEYVDPPHITTITVSIRKDGTVSVESGIVEQKDN